MLIKINSLFKSLFQLKMYIHNFVVKLSFGKLSPLGMLGVTPCQKARAVGMRLKSSHRKSLLDPVYQLCLTVAVKRLNAGLGLIFGLQAT